MKSIERAARALCRAEGNPENTRFEGRAMWESYVPEARAVLDAVGFDRLLAALVPFAIAMQRHGEVRSVVDDTLIRETSGGKPLVTFDALREARDAITALEPAALREE